MSGKIIVSVISMILVVGAVIGVVAVVRHNGNAEAELSPKMKAVTNFCSSVDYQKTCQKTLSSVNNTEPKEYVAQSILASQEAVKKFLNFSDSLIVRAKNDNHTKMALDDCKEMMNYAVQSLQASYSEVGNGEFRSINDKIMDLRTWLSAVISYQESCLDGFDHKPTMKKIMKKGNLDARELTANALAIVTKLTDILSKFGLQFNTQSTSTSRKLFSVKNDGFPSWFSASDRKLLGKIDNGNLRPNVVVAKDGSGQFKTIGAALAAAPKNSKVRHVIYVKAGIYAEYVVVENINTNILMYGDGPKKTIVTGNRSTKGTGHSTWQTSTFSAIGNGFIARSMGFQNTAGPIGHQAVALRVQSDKSAFFNCRMDGYQDTLFNQANRQFFRNCVISGTIDFIFGDSITYIQNSLIIVRRPLDNQFNTITAQGKEVANELSVSVIHNCKIVPEQKLFVDRFRLKTYLGRPWKQFGTTVVIESNLGDLIQPEGWVPWKNYENTCFYAEYNNRGPGANLARRVNWKGYHKIDRKAAMGFTIQALLLGGDNWLSLAGIPFTPALRY